MKLQVYAVYDSAARAYATPVFVRTKAEAIRSFTDACADQNGPFFRHYADYHLAFLGEYDDNDGTVVCPSAPQRVISASECVDQTIFPPEKKVS